MVNDQHLWRQAQRREDPRGGAERQNRERVADRWMEARAEADIQRSREGCEAALDDEPIVRRLWYYRFPWLHSVYESLSYLLFRWKIL